MANFDYVIKAEIDGDAVATETASSYQTAIDAAHTMRVANPKAEITVIDTYRDEDRPVYILHAPEVGKPVTYSIGGDAYVYEVVEVSKSGKQVKIGRGGVVTATLRLNKRGRFASGCGFYTFGIAVEKRDPSF